MKFSLFGLPEYNAFYLNEGGMIAEEWCADKISEDPYCFRGTIPKARDENCLCPTHDCHLDENEDDGEGNEKEKDEL